MNGWLRRNRWALLALTILVPAAIVAAMSIDAFRYFGSRAQQGTTVAEGEQGSYVPLAPIPEDDDAPLPDPPPPATIRLDDYLVVPWDSEGGREVGLLEGTEAVSILIEVDATGMPEDVYSCDAILVAPGQGGERVWPIASGSDIDYYPSGDLHAYCDLNSGEQFVWEAVFVVPEGVAADADLFITRGSVVKERVLRLEH
jgi:hypothetical protein